MEIMENNTVTITFTKDELNDIRLALVLAVETYREQRMPHRAAEIAAFYQEIKKASK